MPDKHKEMKRAAHIFVVDDELHVRTTIAAILEQYGYLVTSFANGHDALAAFKRSTCDLVITDVKMPKMDGVELLGHIHAIDPDVPVILMTAYANLNMAIDAIKSGAFDFILKPYGPDYLLTAIDKGIKHRNFCRLENDYNSRLRAILETVLDSIITINSRGIIQSFNPAASLLFGYAVDEVIGKNIKMLMPEPYHSKHDGHLARYLETQEPHIIGVGREVVGLRKNGTTFPLDLAVSESIVGGESLFTAAIRDLTERKRMDADRKENEALLSQILDGNAIATFVINEQHEVTHWNHACEKLTGIPASEMIGTSDQWRPFYRSERRILADLIVDGMQEGELSAHYSDKHRKSAFWNDGYEVEDYYPHFGEDGCWLFVTAVPLRNGRGKTIGAIETLQDTTQRMEVKEELTRSKELAEAASLSKSEFLANMSHEIRTPLNAIIGFSDLALKTELTPKQHDYIHKIHRSGKSLLGIINDILDFSKIESGRMELEQIDFVLEETLSQVISVIQYKALEKGVEFLFTPSPAIPQRLVGDPLRLGQILMNLLGNAVKFTNSGEIELVVDVTGQTDKTVILRFEVHDTGIGLTTEQAQLLFQPFTQADGSTTRKFGGTGLGLSICKRLVELMGGEIEVKSVFGKGSVFSFTLSFGHALISGANTIPKVPHGLRILVVDDNLVSRRSLVRLLEGLPVEVEVATSGQTAIDLVQSQDAGAPFQLVLMDWNMPEMDGIEATRQIKNGLALQNVPHVVIVTGFGKEREQAEALSAGADDFLHKPLTPSTLYDVITRLFSPDELSSGKCATVVECDYDFTGLHLLLAEDNELNQQIACELLEGVGATVSVACNGHEALEMVVNSGQHFDVVLMDIQMPEMDGIDATRLIRKDSRFSALPIIALTAHAFAEERQRALMSGMNDHITKPIDSQELMETICRHLPDQLDNRKKNVRTTGDGASITAFGQVQGLDTVGALKRINGNEKLYLNILKKFRTVQCDAADRISAALAADERETAKRVAHTLKGLAGSIGAVVLMNQAADLELAINNNASSEQTNLVLTQFSHELVSVMSMLDTVLIENAESAIAGELSPPDRSTIEEFVNLLESHIKESNSESADLLTEYRHHLVSFFGPKDLAQLERCIADYDFDEALTTLQTMSARTGLNQQKDEPGGRYY